MCNKHHNDYDKIDIKLDIDYKTERFIRKVIDPSGSRYSDMTLKELRWKTSFKIIIPEIWKLTRPISRDSTFLGRIRIRMDDGAEEEFGPGDAAVIPSGYNACLQA